MYITHEMLVEKGACESERRRFCEIFPDGVEVTPAQCLENWEFDYDWAGEYLLSRDEQEQFFIIEQRLWCQHWDGEFSLPIYKRAVAITFGMIASKMEMRNG